MVVVVMVAVVVVTVVVIKVIGMVVEMVTNRARADVVIVT